MNCSHTNPKALNIAAIKQSHKLVTVGFKAPPDLKLILIKKAQTLGMTLSEYIAALLENHEDTGNELKLENEKVNRESYQLNEKLNFYEMNPVLQNLLHKHKNKDIAYININGEKVSLKITTINDVFTVMVNSFKTA